MNRQELKASIKHNELISREIRTHIHASKGLARYEAWNEKRALGAETRLYLCAYALLRNTPYEKVETNPAFLPNVTQIAALTGLGTEVVMAWVFRPVTITKVAA